MAGAKLPDTKPHRVVIAGVRYLKPTEVLDADSGDTVVRQVADLATFGQEVQLTDREARRLGELEAVKPADAPLGYEEMNEVQLADIVRTRGITVQGSGANGAVLRQDQVNALTIYDQAQGTGLGTLADPVAPAAAAPAADDEVVAFVREATVDDVVAKAGSDPLLAQRLLDAEHTANDGEPRKGVVDGLTKIIEA